MNKSSNLYQAAVFFLKHSGQRGTDKQVEKLLKQIGPMVVSMAAQRGFKGV